MPRSQTIRRQGTKTARHGAAARGREQAAGLPAALQRTLANPASAAPGDVAALQRMVGNRAVQRLVDGARHASARPPRPASRQTETAQRAADPHMLQGGPLANDTESAIRGELGRGQTLDVMQRAPAERTLGADFAGVRVHTDSQSDRLNRSLSAKAFTVGSDIFFSRGAFSPASGGGRDLLNHELTHVAQQGGGQANKVQAKLEVGPANDRYEQEADRVARNTAAGQPATAQAGGGPGKSLQRGLAIQRALVVGGIPVSQENLTPSEVAIGDRRVTFEDENEYRKIKSFLKLEQAIFEFNSVEDLEDYLDDPVTNKDKMTVKEAQRAEESVEPPTQPEKKGKWWKWALGVAGMIPGVGGAMLGAKTGWKAGKGGVKGFFAGLGLGIAGAAAHILATAVMPVVGAFVGAAGGARAGWNKTMRGAKGNFALGGLIAAVGGGIGGAVAGAGMGLAATTVGAGPQAVDPAMVDEAFGTTETTERMKAQKINVRDVKMGDIILVHGGDDMGTGFIKFGQSLHQLWSGKSRKASTGFRHAGVAISSSMWAHVTGEGASLDKIGNGVLVYRPSSRDLAYRAAGIAATWAATKGKIGYAKSKAMGSMLNASDYSQTRASVLAAYFRAGVSPGDMFCSEFAISTYQAAALLPAVKELEEESGTKLPEMSKDKPGVKKWATKNKSKLDTPSNMLKLDPRFTSPQMLAAELARLSEGEDPQWSFIGQVD